MALRAEDLPRDPNIRINGKLKHKGMPVFLRDAASLRDVSPMTTNGAAGHEEKPTPPHPPTLPDPLKRPPDVPQMPESMIPAHLQEGFFAGKEQEWQNLLAQHETSEASIIQSLTAILTPFHISSREILVNYLARLSSDPQLLESDKERIARDFILSELEKKEFASVRSALKPIVVDADVFRKVGGIARFQNLFAAALREIPLTSPRPEAVPTPPKPPTLPEQRVAEVSPVVTPQPEAPVSEVEPDLQPELATPAHETISVHPVPEMYEREELVDVPVSSKEVLPSFTPVGVASAEMARASEPVEAMPRFELNPEEQDLKPFATVTKREGFFRRKEVQYPVDTRLGAREIYEKFLSFLRGDPPSILYAMKLDANGMRPISRAVPIYPTSGSLELLPSELLLPETRADITCGTLTERGSDRSEVRKWWRFTNAAGEQIAVIAQTLDLRETEEGYTRDAQFIRDQGKDILGTSMLYRGNEQRVKGSSLERKAIGAAEMTADLDQHLGTAESMLSLHDYLTQLTAVENPSYYVSESQLNEIRTHILRSLAEKLAELKQEEADLQAAIQRAVESRDDETKKSLTTKKNQLQGPIGLLGALITAGETRNWVTLEAKLRSITSNARSPLASEFDQLRLLQVVAHQPDARGRLTFNPEQVEQVKRLALRLAQSKMQGAERTLFRYFPQYVIDEMDQKDQSVYLPEGLVSQVATFRETTAQSQESFSVDELRTAIEIAEDWKRQIQNRFVREYLAGSVDRRLQQYATELGRGPLSPEASESLLKVEAFFEQTFQEFIRWYRQLVSEEQQADELTLRDWWSDFIAIAVDLKGQQFDVKKSVAQLLQTLVQADPEAVRLIPEIPVNREQVARLSGQLGTVADRIVDQYRASFRTGVRGGHLIPQAVPAPSEEVWEVMEGQMTQAYETFRQGVQLEGIPEDALNFAFNRVLEEMYSRLTSGSSLPFSPFAGNGRANVALTNVFAQGLESIIPQMRMDRFVNQSYADPGSLDRSNGISSVGALRRRFIEVNRSGRVGTPPGYPSMSQTLAQYDFTLRQLRVFLQGQPENISDSKGYLAEYQSFDDPLQAVEIPPQLWQGLMSSVDQIVPEIQYLADQLGNSDDIVSVAEMRYLSRYLNGMIDAVYGTARQQALEKLQPTL